MLWTFLAVIFGLLAGVGAALVSDLVKSMHASEPPKSRRYVAGLIVAIVVAVTIQAIATDRTHSPSAVGVHAQQNSTDSGSTEALSASGVTPTPAPNMTLGAAPTSVEQTTVPTPVIMATSLLDLPAVNEDTNNSIDLDQTGTTTIDGVTYGRVLAYECSLFCNGESPQVFEVTLGKQFRIFTATAAVLDTSAGAYRIDISLDGHAPVTYTTSPGAPTPIRMDVEGISRLRVQIYAPGPLKSAVQAGADSAVGKNGSGLPGVALADPIVLP